MSYFRFSMAIFTLLLPVAAAAQTRPRMTEAQAIQHAADFCRRLGFPVSVPGTAWYPSSDIDKHWQPRWQVIFPEQAEVEVVDATGVVSWYTNTDFSRRSQMAGRQPAGEPIPEQEAIQRATAVLQATGQRGELAFDKATRSQHSDPPDAWLHIWRVDWRRQYKGIPYRRGHFVVSLQAETGEVMRMGVVFFCPPPTDTIVSVQREQAAEIAFSRLTQRGVQGAVLTEARTQTALPNGFLLDAPMQVVMPNTFYEPNGTAASLPGPGRVAWVVYFQKDDSLYEVWVDAQTGQVLGGEKWGLRGGKPAARPSLQQALKTAREVRIYARGANGKWQETPLAVLSETTEARLLHLLQKEGRFRAYGPAVAPDYRVVVVGAEKATSELTYVAFEGALGAEGQWCLVPKEFKAWMDRLKPKGAR